MKRFAGLIALVGILGVGSWLALRGKDPRGRAATTAAASAGAQASPALDAPTISSAPPLATPAAAEPASVPGTRTAVATPYEEELARAIWVEGRVLFPPGTPADEKAVVVALGKKFEHGERHRAEVAADGRFRVAFSEKTKSGQLTLEARYLYLSEVGRWKASDADAEVTLEPLLGGRIEGKLVLPAGARADTGGKVQLQRFHDEDSDDDEPIDLGADLSFAFGCLDPQTEYSVSYDGATFVGSSPRFAIEPGGTHTTEVELRPGVVLAGRVLDEAGLPVSGFRLSASNRAGRSAGTWRSTSSADDGSFRLDAISPGEIELEGSKKGFTKVERKLGKLVEGEHREELELVLMRGNALAGRVQWPDGTPAEKAWVSVTEERGELVFDATTQQATSADGSFQFSGLGEGPFRVSAGGTHAEEVAVKSELTGRERKRKQRETWRDEKEHVAAGTNDLVLTLSSGLSVSGRVVDERGTNVDDFAVRAHPSGRMEDWVDGASKSFLDAGGAFTLVGLSPGSWELSATAKGYADSKPVTVAVPSTAPLELVVLHAASLRGVVLDPHGAPVASAQLLQELENLSWRPDYSRDRSNERGVFTIEQVPPGSVTLTASAAGYAPSEPLRLELEAGEVRDGLVLNLRVGGTVAGEVIGPGARPEVDQQVSLYSDAGHSDYTTTDGQGNFVFTGVPAGAYSIESASSGGLELHAEITLSEGEAQHVRLAPPDGALIRVHGHVTIGGQAAGGIDLSANLEREEDGALARSSGTECDSDGAYELTLPGAGRYRLSLSRFDGGDLFSWNTSIDVPGVAEFTCDLVVPTGRVRGRVTGRDGRPIAGVLVRNQFEEDWQRTNTNAQTHTDSDGRYELLVVAGPLTVVAGGKDWSPSEDAVSWSEARITGLSVAANQELAGIDFVLSAGGTLAGHVRRAGGGPISDAVVFRCEGSEHHEIGYTDGDDGAFRITGLQQGDLLVGAASEHATTLRPVSVTIEPGRTTEIEIELVSAVWAHVLVHDAAGASIPCDITALDGEGRPCPVTRTRTDGEAGLGPLVAGRYTVRAERDGKRVERAFEVRGDEEKLELTLTLTLE